GTLDDQGGHRRGGAGARPHRRVVRALQLARRSGFRQPSALGHALRVWWTRRETCWVRTLVARPSSATDGQRNGRAEDVVGIVMPLGFGEAFDIGTIAFCYPLRVLPREEIRISARKRHPAKRLKSGSDPPGVPCLF